MNFLYLTADTVGTSTGGGKVTREESEALKELGPCEVWDRVYLGDNGDDPWCWDDAVHSDLRCGVKPIPKLCHIYSGTFTKTVDLLKANGCKVTYTCAAHDKEISRREHEELGVPFPYTHLTDPDLWKRYSAGYFAADTLIVPSRTSERIVREYGARNRVEVIPHGVDLPGRVLPVRTDTFVVGYLGAVGPDKGLRYLLTAWQKLNYSPSEACLLLAGSQSQSEMMLSLCQYFAGVSQWEPRPTGYGDGKCLVGVNEGGRGKIILFGWVNDVADFYDCLSCYVQPSASEGFGIEVLEAMAHGRPVICSEGAGAADLLLDERGEENLLHCEVFKPGDADELYECIRWQKKNPIMYNVTRPDPEFIRDRATSFTWHKIRARYQKIWKELL